MQEILVLLVHLSSWPVFPHFKTSEGHIASRKDKNLGIMVCPTQLEAAGNSHEQTWRATGLVIFRPLFNAVWPYSWHSIYRHCLIFSFPSEQTCVVNKQTKITFIWFAQKREHRMLINLD